MKESRDGLPEIGPTARTLGVRPAGDSTKNPDVLAANPHEIISPGEGGMSVVPKDPMLLLPHRRPASLGGFGFDPVMKPQESIEKALRSDEPLKRLRDLVLNFSVEGKSESEVYKIFEDFILSLRNNGSTYRESDEELLMEVLDAITGWCHPDVRLKLPIYLEPDVADFVRNYAKQKNVETETIVNEWLRSKIAVIQPAL